MAMIDPKDSKSFERNPEEGNFPSGVYLCELSRVQEIGPSAKYPNGNPRLVFEFTVADPQCPQYAGKKAAVFVGRTLLKSKEGRESNLVKLARLMGVANPEKGFDPESLVGRKFQVMTEHTDGRSWARQAMAVAGGTQAAQQPPAAAQPQQQPPANGQAGRRVATPAEKAAGDKALLSAGTEDELKAAWEPLPGYVQQACHDTLKAQKAALVAPPPPVDWSPANSKIPF